MGELKVSLLDVGHGDFVFAMSPKGQSLVIDLGSEDVVPSEFLNNIGSIDELQISHPHADHFDDILAISEKQIKSFRCPKLDGFADKTMSWKDSDKEKISKLREMKRTVPADNDAVPIGDGFGHTVWYPKSINYDNPNTASLVTTLSYGSIKILLGGDLPSSGWDELLQDEAFVRAIKGTTVFKVPHHGREDGCCDELFKVITPKLCIISDKSIDQSNKNTASTDWYSKRSLGCSINGYTEQRKVLTTRTDGSIFIKVNDQGTWWVHPQTKWLK